MNVITALPKSDYSGKAWDQRPLSTGGSEMRRCGSATDRVPVKVNFQDER